MKKIIILCLAVLLSACTGSIELNDPQEFPQDGTALEGVVMSVPGFVFDDIVTRTTITPTQSGLSFAWKSGDEVGVYASRAMANFNITAISEDAKSATFDGGGFSLTKGSSYLAFYPYNGAATDKTSVPVSFTNQTQSANSSTDHLGNYDYLVASTIATAADNAHFEFSHLGAIIRIGFSAPKTGTYSQLSVTSSNGNFITAGTVNLTAESPSITSTASSNSIILKLGSEGISLTKGDTFYAYMVVAPVDMSSSTLTITVKDNGGSVFTSTLSGKNMMAGKAYAYNLGNNNLLSGNFSVSATKKVKFTKSNLYWDGSAFKFEADQTAYPTSWDANHVGHFYWTSITEYQSGNTGYMPYAQAITASTAARSTSDKFFCGEDNKMSVELTPGLFALRADEWNYLVNGRANAGNLSKYPVTVAGKSNCLIIAPDSFTGTLQSSYTLEEVNSLGLVCLPASGYRQGSSFYKGGTYGVYWSSTSDYDYTNNANGLWFNTNTTTTSLSREQALGLRLVWFDESTRVDVTSVSLNKTVVILEKGGTETLTATIAPSNATDQAVTWASSNTSVATVDASGKVTAVAAGTTYISATANNGKTASCRVSVNLLSGEFSVSASRKVKFTRGNLYWNGSTYMFEDNQTDYPTAWDAKHVGHFYWSKYANNSYAELWNNDYGSASDKFFCGEDNKLTVEGVSGLFALTLDEWNYLLNTRKDADDFNKYGVSVTNNGTTYKNCLIIAPDGFTGGELKASYTIDEIISLGLVCLPAAGVRYTYNSAYASEKPYSYLRELGDNGHYWCPTLSSSQSSSAATLYITSDALYLPSYSDRCRGQSIRLVVVSQ